MPLAEHFDVIVPDMRGFAYSDKPDLAPEVGYTDGVMADDLAALVKALGFEKAYVVGNDFGAAWSQRLARSHPDVVEKLVLFNPPYAGIGGRWFGMPQVLESWYMMFHQLDWADELVASSRAATEMYVRHFLRHWSHDSDVFTEEEYAEFVEAYSQPGAVKGGMNCYRAVFRSAGQPQPDPIIRQPTLVLWSDRDPILKFEWSDHLGEFFPNHTLKKIEGAGHFMHAEQPERINSEVIGFLSEAEPRT
jgi:pimeloyl-ACP methyl ester carboxylesterase